jgi:signal transduction histidine kinase
MSDPRWGARALHYRWAFEPALALVIFLVWTGVGLVARDDAGFVTVALCMAAVAFTRLSPVTAMIIGSVGVLSSVTYLYTAQPGLWLILVCGSIVIWGTGLYGRAAVQYIGLAAGYLLSFFVGALIVAPAVTSAQVDAPDLTAVLVSVGLRLLAAALIAAVVLGGWATGLVLRARADRRGGPPAPTAAESWLMAERSDEAAVVLTGPPRAGFRPVSRRQLTVDVAAAIGFFLLALVLDSSAGLAGVLVLLGFSVALAMRRLSPALALSLAWAAAILQMLAGLPVMFGNLAVLAILYATAAYADRVVRWAGLVSVGVGAFLAAVYLAAVEQGFDRVSERISNGNGSAIIWEGLAYLVGIAAVLGLSWTLGLLMRTWQAARESRQRQYRAQEVQRSAQRDVVVEQERNRIARDMHDVVAHSLAVVIAQADGARYARAQDPEAVDAALTTISTTAREALGDVRILLTRLRQDDAAGPQPVLADLDRLVEQMRSTGLDIDWTTTGSPTTLGSGAQLAVYRIVQEALTNALRHGETGRAVYLSLAWTDGWVTVTIDNAIRVKPDVAPAGEIGHGLPGMRERALLAGGSLSAETVGERFVVSGRLPAITTSALTRPALTRPMLTGPAASAPAGREAQE